MKTKNANIPTLTEVVTPAPAAGPSDDVLAAAQAELSVRVLKLAEELTHNAAREIEAVILERVCDQLRERLPELIDETLKSQLKSGNG